MLPTNSKSYSRDMENLVSRLFLKIKLEQPFTAQHSIRTCKISIAIAERLQGFDKNDLNYLKWGTLLHDVGKLFIPTTLLLKAEDLGLEEYFTVASHVKLGYAFLKNHLPSKILEIVLYHHERYDGAGYPSNRRGDEIPLLAKICSVAEAYDAILETNPYHKGLTTEEAYDEIFWNSGTQFDPLVVSAFLDCFNSTCHTQISNRTCPSKLFLFDDHYTGSHNHYSDFVL